MDKSSPLSSSAPLAILPPQPAQGPSATPNQDFREMLATQGIKAPAGAVPTAAEAQIEAAQIAAKANVNMGVKRQPVLSGMQTTAAPTVSATEGRFLPLRQGPSAARAFTGTSPGGPATSVETLRATTKFAPGPVNAPSRAIPATARPVIAKPDETPGAVAPPKAVEAYTYGLRAASDAKSARVPAWFDGAVQNALDKYDALNKANKKQGE